MTPQDINMRADRQTTEDYQEILFGFQLDQIAKIREIEREVDDICENFHKGATTSVEANPHWGAAIILESFNAG